jgi:hypothetical protein
VSSRPCSGPRLGTGSINWGGWLSRVDTGVVDEDVVDRSAVEAVWVALAEGRVSREWVHAWADPLVRSEAGVADDVLTRMGLQFLHGFDLAPCDDAVFGVRHGGPGGYAKSVGQVAADLEAWSEHCAAHDRDPGGWVLARVAAARAAAAEGLV